MRYLVCLLILAAVVAANPTTEEGKKAITRAYESTVRHLKKVLHEAHPSVLVKPLKLLKELEIDGKADQDYVVSFGSGKDEPSFIRFSEVFWTITMSQTIAPYVREPQNYMNMIIDFFPIPPDPEWNIMAEYNETESHINGLVLTVMQEMNDTYEEFLEKTKANMVSEATASSWAKHNFRILLEDVDMSIRMNSQQAKREAANGDYSGALKRVKKVIRDRKEYFDKEVQSIYKQYRYAIDK